MQQGFERIKRIVSASRREIKAEKAHRILVIKHGALGDIIQGLDAYATLRAQFSNAHITLLTAKAFAPLMQSMPYFDAVHIDERAPFWQISNLLSVRSFLRDNFDMIIDLQCSKRTNRYHQFLVRKGQVWFGTADNCAHPYPDFTGVNNAERMRIAADMAAKYIYGQKAIGRIEADLSFLSADKKAFSLPDNYAVLLPGCSPAKPSKRWPAKSYAKLAEMLIDKQIRPVLIGTKIDADACDEIARLVPQSLNLCQQTNLAELAAITSDAQLVVGNDSGPIFLAAKTGAPSWMMMGQDTDPSMSAPSGANAHYIKTDDLRSLSAEEVMQTIFAKS